MFLKYQKVQTINVNTYSQVVAESLAAPMQLLLFCQENFIELSVAQVTNVHFLETLQECNIEDELTISAPRFNCCLCPIFIQFDFENF